MLKFRVSKSGFYQIAKSIAGDSYDKVYKDIISFMKDLEKKEESKEVKKAIEYFESSESNFSHLEKSVNGDWIEKAGYGVGTIRIWKGKKYKKISASPTRWVRVFDKNDRGAKNAMTRLIHQAEKYKNDPEGMMKLLLENKQRFYNEDSKRYLDIVDRLNAFVDNADSTGPMGENQVKEIHDKIEENKKKGKKVTPYEAQKQIDDEKLMNKVKEINDAAKKKNIDYSKMTSTELEKINKESCNKFKKDGDEESFEIHKIVSKQIRINDAKLPYKRFMTSLKTIEEKDKYLDERISMVDTNINKTRKSIDRTSDTRKKNDKVDMLHKYELDREALVQLRNDLYDEHDAQKESESEKYQNRSNAMMGNDNAKKDGVAEDPISNLIEKYANDKQIKNTINKVSVEDFTSVDPNRAFMNGTYQEDGYKIATDGHFLAMIKSDYPAEDEGKVKADTNKKFMKHIDKTIAEREKMLNEVTRLKDEQAKVGVGTYRYKQLENREAELNKEIEDLQKTKETGYVNGQFPNYKRVIPSRGNANLETPEGFTDFDKIIKTAKIASAYIKEHKNENIGVTVKVGERNFNPDQLVKVIAMAKKYGLNEVLVNSNSGVRGAVEFKGNNGSVVLMPMNGESATSFNATTGEITSDAGEYDEKLNKFKSGEETTKVETEEDKIKAEKKAEKDSRKATEETKNKMYEDAPEGVTEQNYKKYIDMGSKLYAKWGYDMNDPRQQKQLKGQINDIVQQINNKDFSILESLENTDNVFTRTIWMVQTGGVSPDKSGVEKYFGKEATEKHKKELEEKRVIYEQKKKENEKRILTNKVDSAFRKQEYFSKQNYVGDKSKETLVNYLENLPSNRQESAIKRLSENLIKYKKDGKEKVGYMLDYIIDQIDDGTSIDNIKAAYRDIKSKPIVSFAQWYADSKIGVTKSVLLNDFDEFIDFIDDESDEEEIQNYDASTPELFNSTSYKVADALDECFGCK